MPNDSESMAFQPGGWVTVRAMGIEDIPEAAALIANRQKADANQGRPLRLGGLNIDVVCRGLEMMPGLSTAFIAPNGEMICSAFILPHERIVYNGRLIDLSEKCVEFAKLVVRSDFEGTQVAEYAWPMRIFLHDWDAGSPSTAYAHVLEQNARQHGYAASYGLEQIERTGDIADLIAARLEHADTSGQSVKTYTVGASSVRLAVKKLLEIARARSLTRQMLDANPPKVSGWALNLHHPMFNRDLPRLISRAIELDLKVPESLANAGPKVMQQASRNDADAGLAIDSSSVGDTSQPRE